MKVYLIQHGANNLPVEFVKLKLTFSDAVIACRAGCDELIEDHGAVGAAVHLIEDLNENGGYTFSIVDTERGNTIEWYTIDEVEVE